MLPKDRMLPGAVYGAEEQCKMSFPKYDGKPCKASEDKFCEKLSCQSAPNACISKGEPPADGTKCAENKVI